MKKIIALILVIVLSLSLSGCGLLGSVISDHNAHGRVSISITPAGCTEEGYKDQVCSICGVIIVFCYLLVISYTPLRCLLYSTRSLIIPTTSNFSRTP